MAKLAGRVHCYRGVCHRVLTIDETRRLVGVTRLLEASAYDDPSVDRFNKGMFTSNGERFNAGDAGRVAAADLPDGTLLLLRNPENGATSHVLVNDFGPFYRSRRIDATRRVAEDLGFTRRGVTPLEVTVLAAPRPEDTHYKRGRRLTGALGYIGKLAEPEVTALIAELADSGEDTMVASAGSQAASEGAPTDLAHAPSAAIAPAAALMASADAPSAAPGEHALPVRDSEPAQSQSPAAPPFETLVVAAAAVAPAAEPAVMLSELASPVAADALATNGTDPLTDGATAAAEAVPAEDRDSPTPVLLADAGWAVAVAEPPDGARPDRIDRIMASAHDIVFGRRSLTTASSTPASFMAMAATMTALLLYMVFAPRSARRLRGAEAQAATGTGLMTRAPASDPPPRWPWRFGTRPLVHTATEPTPGTPGTSESGSGARDPATYIAPDLTLTGTVRSSGCVRIAGRFDGSIAAATLVVERFGVVEGDVEARTVVVEGRVKGSVSAERLTASASATIDGTITAGTIGVEHGAVLNARVYRVSPRPGSEAADRDADLTPRAGPAHPDCAPA